MYPDLKHTIIATPSISPMFSNNPGYTYMEVTNTGISEIYFRYLKLYQYYFFSFEDIFVVKPSQFGIDINNPDNIRDF